MKKDLPKYKISIDPKLSKDGVHLGIQEIAYTATPAILTKGIYFNDQVKVLSFKDDLKMRVAAPALIPMSIYRFDDEMGEYEVEFTAEEIELLVEDFKKHVSKDFFNLDHNKKERSPSYILSDWIIEDPATDQSFTKYGIEGLTKGTYFIVSQFTDRKFFEEEIVAKGRTGYSIEGFLGMKLNEIKQKFIENKMENTEIKLEDTSREIELTAEITALKAELEALKLAAVTPATPEAEAETETPAEAPAEDSAEDKALDEAEVMKIVQPKLDELIKAIAEIKSLVETPKEEATPAEEKTDETKMSSHLNGFVNFSKAMKKKK